MTCLWFSPGLPCFSPWVTRRLHGRPPEWKGELSDRAQFFLPPPYPHHHYASWWLTGLERASIRRGKSTGHSPPMSVRCSGRRGSDWLLGSRFSVMMVRTSVASDLRRVSHENSSIYSGFVPDAGTSQDLLCEVGAQSVYEVLSVATCPFWSSPFSRYVGSSCQASPVRSMACTTRARRRAVATRATCQPRRWRVCS